jgi:hypothetical protein
MQLSVSQTTNVGFKRSPALSGCGFPGETFMACAPRGTNSVL